MPLQLPESPTTDAKLGIGDLIFIVLATLLAALIVFALIRAELFYSLYTWLLQQVTEFSGFDIWLSRAITLGFVAILWFFPWHILVLPWIGGAGKRAAIFIAITVAALAAMEFVTRDVFFSREDGSPLKYYIVTPDGYRFASEPGTDPVYGLPYQPLTAEVANQYLLWHKRGGQIQDPAVPKDQYYDTSTGAPIRWYAQLPDGRIEMFTLPAFHPRYGTRLLPVTNDIIRRYEKQKEASQPTSTAPPSAHEPPALAPPPPAPTAIYRDEDESEQLARRYREAVRSGYVP